MTEWPPSFGKPASTIVVVGMIVIGAAGGGVLFGDHLAKWIKGGQGYELIDFDANQTRAYAQGLSLIHI